MPTVVIPLLRAVADLLRESRELPPPPLLRADGLRSRKPNGFGNPDHQVRVFAQLRRLARNADENALRDFLRHPAIARAPQRRGKDKRLEVLDHTAKRVLTSPGHKFIEQPGDIGTAGNG